MRKPKVLISFIFLFLLIFGTYSLAQQKVVVIPLGPDGTEVDPFLVPIAIRYVSVAPNSAAFFESVGFDSVTKVNGTTGEIRLILSNSTVGQNIIQATSFNNTPKAEIVTATSISANEIEINIADHNDQPINSNFFVTVYARTE